MGNAPSAQRDRVAQAEVRPRLHLQWHITSQCGNRCAHCYMADPGSFEREHAGSLDLSRLLDILRCTEDFEKKWGARIDDILVTGGDPLLHTEWKPFVAALRRRGKRVGLFGNPETLTAETTRTLADLGVGSFQMSLDGLEETHDRLRSRGSFARTLDKLDLLAAHRVRPHLMFTLFPENADELVPLLQQVAERTPAAVFSFDFGCFIGGASGRTHTLTAGRARELLFAYIEEKRRLQAAGNPLIMDEKPNLMRLVRLANKEFYPVAAPDLHVVSGCLCGWTGVSILPDGTVLACRRLPLPVGSMPSQSFEEIFLGSELMRRFRRPRSFAECGSCDLYPFCRGCPAYVYSVTDGDPFARHPLCFRSEIGPPCGETPNHRPSPRLDLSNEEEYALLTGRFSSTAADRVPGILQDDAVQRLFLTLACSVPDRHKYLAEPYRYAATRSIRLPDMAHVFLMQHFTRGDADIAGDDARGPLVATVLEMMLVQEPRTRRAGLREVISRAWADAEFRQALLASPRATIESALRTRLPPNLEVFVHQQSRDAVHIVLPATPSESRRREQRSEAAAE